jgi:hypothetical protein
MWVKKRLKHRAANFCWTRSSLLASVVVMLVQTGEAYSNLDLTKVTYNNKKLSKVEKKKVVVRMSPNVFSDCENT